MLKTPVGAGLLTRLEALNDQLCFFLMLRHQLVEQLSGFSAALGDAFTSDLFARNPYAPKIHVPLKRLPQFQDDNSQFTFGAYVATSYEVASDFFGGASGLLAATLGVNLQRATGIRGGPEDHYRGLLIANAIALPSRPTLETFTYLRHRRNAFIHLSPSPAAVYQAAAAANGSTLNAAWGTTAEPIDFSVADIGPLAEDEAITALKLLRIGVKELDDHLAQSLGPGNIAQLVAVQLFGSMETRLNTDVVASRVKKITAKVEHDYGVMCSDADAILAATTVGVL